MLSTYRLADLTGFIAWLFEEVREETLKEQWLHTQMTQSFKDFKKQQLAKTGVSTVKAVSKQAQQQALDFAYQFIKPTPLMSESEVD